jgi:hypothetical protein
VAGNVPAVGHAQSASDLSKKDRAREEAELDVMSCRYGAAAFEFNFNSGLIRPTAVYYPAAHYCGTVTTAKHAAGTMRRIRAHERLLRLGFRP